MPKAGLTTEVVVERASLLLEQVGNDGMTLAAVAESLGVRTPSLYKHVDGLAGLRRGIMLRAKRLLTAELTRATIGRARGEAVRGLAVAYRRWALSFPMQYPMTTLAAEPDDDDDRAVSEEAVGVLYAVLDGYGLSNDDAVDAARFFRSALHGFVSLETGGAFRLPVDLERSFDKAVDAVIAALEAWSR